MIPRYHLPTGDGSLTKRQSSQATGSARLEMAAVIGVKLVFITNHPDVIYPRDDDGLTNRLLSGAISQYP